MTRLNLNDTQLETIHGGASINCDACEKPPATDKFSFQGDLGGGGVDTETLHQNRDLPGA